MKPNQNPDAVSGWKGGFAESNPDFAYDPEPNLTSLCMQGNLANIPKITRQQAVFWPEFSWETIKEDPASRCFQMFAHDISRLGYDDTGRIWSIICPQQGTVVSNVGCMNVEVTVTGQRGWVNETDRTLAADMTVEGKIWFSPSLNQHGLVREAWKLFAENSLPFPSHKATAIEVTTHKVGNPEEPIFPLRAGESKRYESPEFARHWEHPTKLTPSPGAWTVGDLDVEIGPIKKTGHDVVDAFNQDILDVFNVGSGNMLQDGNVLTWDVWFTAPEYVDTEKWRTHAERWRHSIQVDHGESPDGSVSTQALHRDGKTPFSPVKNLEEELKRVLESDVWRGLLPRPARRGCSPLRFLGVGG